MNNLIEQNLANYIEQVIPNSTYLNIEYSDQFKHLDELGIDAIVFDENKNIIRLIARRNLNNRSSFTCRAYRPSTRVHKTHEEIYRIYDQYAETNDESILDQNFGYSKLNYSDKLDHVITSIDNDDNYILIRSVSGKRLAKMKYKLSVNKNDHKDTNRHQVQIYKEYLYTKDLIDLNFKLIKRTILEEIDTKIDGLFFQKKLHKLNLTEKEITLKVQDFLNLK